MNSGTARFLRLLVLQKTKSSTLRVICSFSWCCSQIALLTSSERRRMCEGLTGLVLYIFATSFARHEQPKDRTDPGICCCLPISWAPRNPSSADDKDDNVCKGIRSHSTLKTNLASGDKIRPEDEIRHLSAPKMDQILRDSPD